MILFYLSFKILTIDTIHTKKTFLETERVVLLQENKKQVQNKKEKSKIGEFLCHARKVEEKTEIKMILICISVRIVIMHPLIFFFQKKLLTQVVLVHKNKKQQKKVF